MAIKLDTSGKLVRVTPPEGSYFNVSMLENMVGGWPDPNKIGPIWIIKNDDAEKTQDNYNEIASSYFQSPVYGDILSVSALELPPEWDLVDDLDKKFSVEELDAGFVKAIQDRALSNAFENPMDAFNSADPFVSLYNDRHFDEYPKEEYFYNPFKPKNPQTTHDNYINFLKDSYEFIVDSAKDDFKDFIVYEDDINIVKVRGKENRVETINQVIDLFIEEEDYEKCAVLRDILSTKLKPTVKEKS